MHRTAMAATRHPDPSFCSEKSRQKRLSLTVISSCRQLLSLPLITLLDDVDDQLTQPLSHFFVHSLPVSQFEQQTFV